MLLLPASPGISSPDAGNEAAVFPTEGLLVGLVAQSVSRARGIGFFFPRKTSFWQVGHKSI